MEPKIIESNYLWFDLEFSTLDLDRAQVLQAAVLATGPDLRPLAAPESDFVCCVRIADETALSPWVLEHLSDLVERCRSAEALPLEALEERLCAAARAASGPRAAEERDQRPVLAGNSLHNDWCIARRLFPRFADQLHYRHLDVTGWKLQWNQWYRGPVFDKDNADLVRTWYPGPAAELAGRPHDAYYDVRASVAELNFYRSQLRR